MLLTESKVNTVLTEGLRYHLQTKTPLYENIYRPGSQEYFNTVRQARLLMNKGLLTELCFEDMELLFETEVGEYGEYNGQKVPLDFPMLMEIEMVIPSPAASWEQALKIPQVIQMGQDKWLELAGKAQAVGGLGSMVDYSSLETLVGPLPKGTTTFPDNAEVQMPTVVKYKNGDKVVHKLVAGADILASLLKTSIDPSIWVVDLTDEKQQVTEAKYQGKEVTLNKPKRGGPKKFYVYTRNPKTGKIIKVNFGDTSGLSAKINNPEARRNFAKRHNCATKKDKTKAGYWSCRLPRYAKLLGLKSSFGGFW